MALYLRERRRCKDCEYYFREPKRSGRCYFNPPLTVDEYDHGQVPIVSENSFCSKWEPRWDDNPVLREAWNEFILVRKLITSGEDEGEQ